MKENEKKTENAPHLLSRGGTDGQWAESQSQIDGEAAEGGSGRHGRARRVGLEAGEESRESLSLVLSLLVLLPLLLLLEKERVERRPVQQRRRPSE